MYVRDEVHLFVNRYGPLILLLHPNLNARKRIHTLQKDKQGSFFYKSLCTDLIDFLSIDIATDQLKHNVYVLYIVDE